MRFLLDTHVAIWLLTEPSRIPAEIFDPIADPDNSVYVSVVSIWETAFKFRLGRADSPPFSGSAAIAHFETAGFSLLDIKATHAAFVERLPPIHQDPFDRLMLAQSIVEGMQFVTYDQRLSRYDAAILTWP
ncbi:type II toxin-antitoxin system VapC family toxin [Oryzicola mucosus]|uniref:Type II toxin-antitoxin system VapC family toxin n=1 Tax=Oryzicola mucosus TaxID=2767425 RepID=A0A8J6PQC1_9HYPH|nr:type II toxin-antitoxin system VapC family toxin [Oryzicola mucosus]